jgi:hypothetical protein
VLHVECFKESIAVTSFKLKSCFPVDDVVVVRFYLSYIAMMFLGDLL